MAGSEEYNFGDTFTIATSLSAIPVPTIDKRFANKLFSVGFINEGLNDVYVYPVDSQGGRTLRIPVVAGGAQLSEQFGWGSIAGGFEAIALVAPSSLAIQVYSRDGPEKATPPVVPVSIIATPSKPKQKFLQVKSFNIN